MRNPETPKKANLLEECITTMKKPNVNQWYEQNLTGKPQYYTLLRLEKAVLSKHLSAKDALTIAFVVGLQWNDKFEGVP